MRKNAFSLLNQESARRIWSSVITLGAILIVAATSTGCAVGIAPVSGFVFTEVSGPLAASSASGARKGSARCTSILGAIAMGDCSIETAKKNGGIATVASVDYKTRSILGLFAEVTVIVTGS